MPALTPPKHPLERFTWTPAAGMLTTEASDLGPRFCGRLYDDACDVGFIIVYPEGSEVLFSLAHEQRDREGDLMYEDFSPVTPGSQAGDITVRVYND